MTVRRRVTSLHGNRELEDLSHYGLATPWWQRIEGLVERRVHEWSMATPLPRPRRLGPFEDLVVRKSRRRSRGATEPWH